MSCIVQGVIVDKKIITKIYVMFLRKFTKPISWFQIEFFFLFLFSVFLLCSLFFDYHYNNKLQENTHQYSLGAAGGYPQKMMKNFSPTFFSQLLGADFGLLRYTGQICIKHPYFGH